MPGGASTMTYFRTLAVPGLFVLFALIACRQGIVRPELPEGVRADYEVFAQRCSKCHSLARPLNAGIGDDAHWELYFERMRMMPGSGITEEDKAPIMRFLHYYSQERKPRLVKGDAEAAPVVDAQAPGVDERARSGVDVQPEETDGGAL